MSRDIESDMQSAREPEDQSNGQRNPLKGSMNYKATNNQTVPDDPSGQDNDFEVLSR